MSKIYLVCRDWYDNHDIISAWSSEGDAWDLVRELNEKYNTSEFGIEEVIYNK